MSLPRHLLAMMLLIAPAVGCDLEEDDPAVPAPAPAEPTRPVPQPQVAPGGQARQMPAPRTTRPPAGPAFAPPLA